MSYTYGTRKKCGTPVHPSSNTTERRKKVVEEKKIKERVEMLSEWSG